MQLSVTRAIKLCGFQDREALIDPKYAERGQDIHTWCKLIVDGMKVDTRSEGFGEIAGHLESFQIWLAETKPVVIGAELEVRNEAMGYLGHLDLACLIKDYPWIIDYKAGSRETWHKRQTALYALAWCAENPGKPTPRRAGLYLKADGSRPLLDEHKDRRDFERGKAIVTVAHDLMEQGKDIE